MSERKVAWRCGRKRRQCSECGWRYTGGQKGLEKCPECGADRRCLRPVSAEGLACRFHGGNSVKGAAHPRFKDGKTSKYTAFLPPQIRARAEAALSNPDLMSMRADIALYEARKMELAKRMYSGEHSSLWKALKAAWKGFDDLGREAKVVAKDLERAKQEAEFDDERQEDVARLTNLLADLRKKSAEQIGAIGKLIKDGARTEAAWHEMEDAISGQAKLKGEEMRRLGMLQQIITAEEAMRYVEALYDAVAEEVSDPKVLGRLAEKFGNIVEYQQKTLVTGAQVVEGRIAPALPPPRKD